MVNSNPVDQGIFILGAGTVGQALGRALREAGVVLHGVYRRTRERAEAAARFVGAPAAWGEAPATLAGAGVVLVAVNDGAIADAVAAARPGFRPGQVVLHCAGAVPASVLRPAVPSFASVGSMHPLQTFASAEVGAGLLRACAYGIEGDEAARAAAREIAARLGGTSFEVPAAGKPLYHAAAAIASNYLVAIAAEAAMALSRASGLVQDQALAALLPLMQGALRSLAAQGLPDALTGPIARGDAAVVAGHLAALELASPEQLPLYRAAGARALALARARAERRGGVAGGAPDGASFDEIERLLTGERHA